MPCWVFWSSCCSTGSSSAPNDRKPLVETGLAPSPCVRLPECGVRSETRKAASLRQRRDGICQRSRRQRGEEIHRLVVDPSAALQRCAKNAVDENSGESGRHG